jgi:hypothetical protein
MRRTSPSVHAPRPPSPRRLPPQPSLAAEQFTHVTAKHPAEAGSGSLTWWSGRRSPARCRSSTSAHPSERGKISAMTSDGSPQCVYCRGVERLTREHYIPRALGTFRGCQPLTDKLCDGCNRITGRLDEAFVRTGPNALFRVLVACSMLLLGSLTGSGVVALLPWMVTEFGWSRAQFGAAITVWGLVSALISTSAYVGLLFALFGPQGQSQKTS